MTIEEITQLTAQAQLRQKQKSQAEAEDRRRAEEGRQKSFAALVTQTLPQYFRGAATDGQDHYTHNESQRADADAIAAHFKAQGFETEVIPGSNWEGCTIYDIKISWKHSL